MKGTNNFFIISRWERDEVQALVEAHNHSLQFFSYLQYFFFQLF